MFGFQQKTWGFWKLRMRYGRQNRQKKWLWSKKISTVETPLSNQILSMHRILSLKYAQPPGVRQALQWVLLTNRVPAEATSNAFWGCGVNMWVVKKSTPKDLFSNWVEGKNYLGWILTLIHAEKTGNFYWLPLLKKLPLSMVEGFQEVKKYSSWEGTDSLSSHYSFRFGR